MNEITFTSEQVVELLRSATLSMVRQETKKVDEKEEARVKDKSGGKVLPYLCPVCAYIGVSEGALRQHCRNKHGMTLKTLRDQKEVK